MDEQAAFDVINRVFDAAPASRRALVESLCREDREMRDLIVRELSSRSADEVVARPHLVASEEVPAEWRRELELQGYSIARRLGQGGMGVVYLARQQDPQRDVAIKIMRGGLSAECALRFEYEKYVLQRLRHPGLAGIYGAGVLGAGPFACPYLVMEFIDGVPLMQFIEERSPATRERMRLVSEIARTIQHAHDNGVIHRDLKPSNILVAQDGRPVVLDFGVAKPTGEGSSDRDVETVPGQIVGTLPYLSPEQRRGGPATTRTDVYGLGALGYEMLTGCTPEQGAGSPKPGGTSRSPVAAVSALRPDIERDVDAIIARALRGDPSERYDSPAQLADDVDRFLEHRPVLARRPSIAYALHRLIVRHPWRAAATVTLAVAALFAFGSLRASLQFAATEGRVLGSLQAFGGLFDDTDRQTVGLMVPYLEAVTTDRHVLGRIGHWHVLRGDFDSALRAYEGALAHGGSDWLVSAVASLRCLTEPGAVPASAEIAEQVMQFGATLTTNGDYERARAVYHRALLFWELEDVERAASTALRIAGVDWRQGRYREARERLEENIRSAVDRGAPRWMLFGLHNTMGVVLRDAALGVNAANELVVDRELARQAVRHLERALDFAGSPAEVAGAKSNLARIYLHAGDFGAAERFYRDVILAFEAGPAMDSAIRCAEALLARARIQLARGNADRARRLARPAADFQRARVPVSELHQAEANSVMAAIEARLEGQPDSTEALTASYQRILSIIGPDSALTLEAFARMKRYGDSASR